MRIGRLYLWPRLAEEPSRTLHDVSPIFAYTGKVREAYVTDPNHSIRISEFQRVRCIKGFLYWATHPAFFDYDSELRPIE